MQGVRLRLGGCVLGPAPDLLRHPRLRLPRDRLGQRLRQQRGHLVHWSPSLRAHVRQGALLRHQSPEDHLENQKRNFIVNQCKIDSFPSHLSKNAVKFIQMILTKDPDARVDI